MDMMCKACNELFDGESNFIEHFMSKHTIRESMDDILKERSLRRKSSAHFPSISICVCEICYKSTADMNTLADHILTHVGAMPYFCETCDFSTISKLHLRQHLLKHMNETTIRMMKHYNFEDLHECEGCNSHFPTWKELVCHYVLHLKSMPFTCQECNMMFSEKRDFTIHNHLHKYSLICDICHGFYQSREKLLAHVLQHDTSKFFNKFSKRLSIDANTMSKSNFPHKSLSTTNCRKNNDYLKTIVHDEVNTDREKSLFPNIFNANRDSRFGIALPHRLEADQNFLKVDTNASKWSITKIDFVESKKIDNILNKTSNSLPKSPKKASCSFISVNVTKLESRKLAVNRSEKCNKHSKYIEKDTDKWLIDVQPNSHCIQSEASQNQPAVGARTSCSSSPEKAKVNKKGKSSPNKGLVTKDAGDRLEVIKPVSVTLERLPSYVQSMAGYKKYCALKNETILRTKKKCTQRKKTNTKHKSHQNNLQVVGDMQKNVSSLNRTCNIFSSQQLPKNDSSKIAEVSSTETSVNAFYSLRSSEPKELSNPTLQKNFSSKPNCHLELVKNLKECSIMLNKLPSHVTNMCSFKKYAESKEIVSTINPQTAGKKLNSKLNDSRSSRLKVTSSVIQKDARPQINNDWKHSCNRNLGNISSLPHVEHLNYPEDVAQKTSKSQINVFKLITNKASTSLLSSNDIKEQDSIPESLIDQGNITKNNSMEFSKHLVNTDQTPTKFSNSMPSVGKKRIGAKSNYMDQITSKKLLRTSQFLREHSQPRKTVKRKKCSGLKTLLSKNLFPKTKTGNHSEAAFLSEKHSVIHAGEEKSVAHNYSIQPAVETSSSDNFSDTTESCYEDNYLSHSNEIPLSSQLHLGEYTDILSDNVSVDNYSSDTDSSSDDPSSSEDLSSDDHSSSDEDLSDDHSSSDEDLSPDHHSAEFSPKSDIQQDDAKEKSPEKVEHKKVHKKRPFTLSAILPSANLVKSNIREKKSVSSIVRKYKISVALPKIKSIPQNVVTIDGITPRAIQTRISEIRRTLSALKSRNNSSYFYGRKTPAVELVRLPDSIYQKYCKGKPIMLSNIMSIDQSVQAQEANAQQKKASIQGS